MEPWILAVDLGTSGAKVALIGVDGRVAAWEAEPVDLRVLPGGGAEQSPEDWWRALTAATRRLLARHDGPAAEVAAVCCSTQGEGTVPVDEHGAPLMDCILWMDMRGAPHLRGQFGGLANMQGMSLARIRRWIRLTGGMPSPTGKDPAAHMLLVRDAFPDVYERTYKFLNVLDFLNLRLTGRFVATYDSILTSWVTDNRDADGGDFGVHLYIGTSSWMAAHVPYKKTDIFSSLASVPCAVPGRWLLTALQATAGGNLTFLRDNILYHEDELLAEAKQPDVFKVFDRIAERVPPGSNGVLYTPWIWGERAPVDDRTLRAGLYNLSLDNTREDVVRAFLEGVALNTRWLLEPVRKFLGRPVNAISLVGGGGNSAVWCQIFADALGVEVRQVKDPIQANARGAAWIAAVGLGEIAFSDVPGLVEFEHVFTPRAEHRAVYDERYQTFLEIHKRMRPLFRRINKGAQ